MGRADRPCKANSIDLIEDIHHHDHHDEAQLNLACGPLSVFHVRLGLTLERTLPPGQWYILDHPWGKIKIIALYYRYLAKITP